MFTSDRDLAGRLIGRQDFVEVRQVPPLVAYGHSCVILRAQATPGTRRLALSCPVRIANEP